tara:strand:+ start:53 stop:250 length:198 start_codon:yes stop_codon:yes gene_type:complete
MKQNPREQIIHETKTHLNRWTQETDLDDEEIVQAYMVAINEWLEIDIIEFTPDDDNETDQAPGPD